MPDTSQADEVLEKFYDYMESEGASPSGFVAQPFASASEDDILVIQDSTFELTQLIPRQREENSMPWILEQIFGSYQPQTEQVQVIYNGQIVGYGERVVDGLPGVDFSWVMCGLVFLQFIKCVFTLIGGWMKSK